MTTGRKLNLCVWGFSSKSLIPVVSSLKEEGHCNVPIWVGGDSKHCNMSRKDFMDLKSFRLPSEKTCDPNVYDKVYPHFGKFVEMFTRYNQFNRYTLYDYLNLFNMQLNYWFEQLREKQIDLVVFARIPHYGPDLLLYETARAMGIKTLMVHQSIFPDRFYYVYDIEDFGYFREVPELTPYEPASIERKFEKDLFYMKNIKPYQYTFGMALRDFKQDWNINAFWRLQQFRKYRRNLKAITHSQIDLNQKFVYFPLHLQPELTTTSLGDEYVDQVLALERLSSMLPDDWFIYVKENPKQTEYMRESLFFERLKRIRHLQVAPIEMSTYPLIQSCQFVATVTGTVCWEALSGGKNALVFGRPPYLKFPGVTQYAAHTSVDEIMNRTFTHEQLEEALARHYMKMARGVVNEHYAGTVENFNIEDNRKKILKFLTAMLAHAFSASGVS